jgi:hypothetical protein
MMPMGEVQPAHGFFMQEKGFLSENGEKPFSFSIHLLSKILRYQSKK